MLRREDPDIAGILVGGSAHKILLYADDILLHLSQPDLSLKVRLNMMEIFSRFSGYKINWLKSEVLSTLTHYLRPNKNIYIYIYIWELSQMVNWAIL